jgi:hypothetical protein
MHSLSFDVAHLLAGSLVLVSFMLLYQDRLYALLNVFALQAGVLCSPFRSLGKPMSKTHPTFTSPLRSHSSSRRSSFPSPCIASS